MKPDRVFKFFLGVILAASIPQYFAVRGCLRPRQNVDPSHPRFSSLAWSVVVAGVLLALRSIWMTLMKPLASKLVDSRYPSSERTRSLQLRQLSANSFKLLYFISVVVWAYFTFRVEPWFPAALGGPSTAALVDVFWEDYPFQPISPSLALYYYINFGYHISVAVCLIVESPLPDFWENFVQLELAVVLMTSSFMANHIRLGCVLMLLHDFCDIFVCATKTFVDTPYKIATISSCAALMVSWALLRLWGFLRMVLLPIFVQLQRIYVDQERAVEATRQVASRLVANVVDSGVADETWAAAARSSIQDLEVMNLLAGWFGFIFFLLSLLLLNIYWFGLMIKSFWWFVKSGETMDLHVRIGDADNGVSEASSGPRSAPSTASRSKVE